MLTRPRLTGLLAGTALLAMGLAAAAQPADDDHAAHHAEAEATAPEGAASPDASGMPGMMGMMTPEMMQMMMRMMAEGAGPGMMDGMRRGAMAEGGTMGRGRMEGGRMGAGPMGQGPMGQGMMEHFMGPGMMGDTRGMGGMATGRMMHGPRGGMGGPALGPGAIYGMPHDAPVEMTPARVEVFLGHLLERHGNPRLQIGEVAEAGDGSITAEIVTRDGSVVQRLAFNRFPGLFRQID